MAFTAIVATADCPKGGGHPRVLCYCGSLDETLPTITVVGPLPVFYEFLPVELR